VSTQKENEHVLLKCLCEGLSNSNHMSMLRVGTIPGTVQLPLAQKLVTVILLQNVCDKHSSVLIFGRNV